MRISPARSCWFFFAISFIVTSSAQGEREMVKPSRVARSGCRHQFSGALGSNHQSRAILLARQPCEGSELCSRCPLPVPGSLQGMGQGGEVGQGQRAAPVEVLPRGEPTRGLAPR